MTAKIARRSLLRGLGGASLALPFLASWRGDSGWNVLNVPVAMAGDGRPRRIIFWAGMLGSLHQYWTPKNTSNGGKTFDLNEIMAPLAPFKDKLTVLTGINYASLYKQQGANGEHSSGAAHMLTSAPYDIVYPWDEKTTYHLSRGPSIDQVIAKRVGKDSRFRSLWIGDPSPHHNTEVKAEDGSVPTRYYDPAQYYDLLFKDFQGNGPEKEKARLSRLSAVSAALPGYEHLSTRLSPSDKLLLDEHMDGLRDMERRLKLQDACAPPSRPAARFSDPVTGGTILGLGQGPYDDLFSLSATALSCQLTNVMTVSFAGYGATPRDRGVLDYDSYGLDQNVWGGADFHRYSHAHYTEIAPTRALRDLHVWRMKKLAAFVDKLSKTPDLDGRMMLDNTCIVHVSDIMTGLHDVIPGQRWGYSNTDPAYAGGVPTPAQAGVPDGVPKGMPMFLLGGLGDKIKTGLHLDLTAENRYGPKLGKYSHGELYLTLARAMGIDAAALPTFGDPEVCKRLVDEVLV